MSSDLMDIKSNPLDPVIRTVMNLLAGRDADLSVLDSRDATIRQAVAAELLTASLDADASRQQRAREVFIKHGYFDDAVRNLRDAESSVDRALAAQNLGLLGSRLATTQLIAALFDPAVEVREAATAALTQIQDPSVMIGPGPDLTDDERKNLLGPDIQQLIAEETTIHRNIANLEGKLSEVMSERARLERLAQSSAAHEATLRSEAQEFKDLEAAASTQAEAEKAKRLEAEKESMRLADDVLRLQSELESLNRSAAELADERTRVSAARLEQTERARVAAQQVYDAELARLTSEEQRLERACGEVARHRADVERARAESDAQAAELTRQHEQLTAAAEARMREAEQSRQRLEAERLKIESELAQRLEEARRLVSDAEARLAEQHRLDEEARERVAEAEKRMAELADVCRQRQGEEKRLADEEQSILRELERLTTAEAEARRRIEQAEAKRRSSDEAQRQADEAAIRLEAEAHLRAVEEEHALAKLEALKRTVAAEVQMRSDQEKRIKEEVAGLQQLAEEERRRLDEETQRRVQAELRLQQERERFKAEAAVRLKADAEYERLKQQSQPPDQAQAAAATEADVEIIRSDLLSDDPMKRAAALAGLVHVEGKDAFGKIVSAFDDESPDVRNAAALALRKIDEERPVEWFTTAFEAASAERRRNIGLAIAGSGLAAEAVNSLSGGTREDTYNALCVLFLMAKTGEVEPLVKAIEHHKDLEVRRAAIRLLTLCGQSEIADAAVKRRLNGYPGPIVS